MIVKDRGWNDLKRDLGELKGSGAKVGILESAGLYDHEQVEKQRARDRVREVRAAGKKLGLTGRSIKHQVNQVKKTAPVSLDMSIAEIAEIHEFGAPRAGIPERSFLRAGLDEGREKIAEVISRLLVQVMARKVLPRKACEILGMAGKTLVQQKLIRGPFVPLKQRTIELKGSSRPLIDTGQLRRSIDYEVVIAGSVGNDATKKGGSFL